MKYTETKKILNQLVADLSQMSMIIHQTHWYMRGPGFLTLHPMMDDFMEDINEQLDEVSERLITLDGAPFSTLKEVADHTRLSDEPGTYTRSVPERVTVLVSGYRYLAALYQQGIEVSEAEKDDCTQDIFIGFKTAIEKRIWMLQAQLEEFPKIAKEDSNTDDELHHAS